MTATPAAPAAAFVGRGLAFPLRTDATGRLALVEDRTEIEEAIHLVVRTAPGERPMRPDFGCRIHDHLFDSINETTVGTVAFDVEQAITRWEPRVDVEAVEVFADPEEASLLYIQVVYRVKHNNDERNLVFPFYTIPNAED